MRAGGRKCGTFAAAMRPQPKLKYERPRPKGTVVTRASRPADPSGRKRSRRPAVAVSDGRIAVRRRSGWALGRRHELGTNGIVDRFGKDAIHVGARLVVEMEAHHIVERRKLTRVPH